MNTPVHVVDIYHGDDPVDFHAMQASGAVGVILKASQGANGTDPKFTQFYTRAQTVFGAGCVHSYHYLTGDDAAAQVAHYLSVTDGMPGRWLDYEDPGCPLPTAIEACHVLSDKIGHLAGVYGSDGAALGDALSAGHFTSCPLWVARYGHPPKHKCDLWQFQGGEINPGVLIGGKAFDLNTYLGTGDCATWMKSVAGSATEPSRPPGVPVG
jgi:GH25 family lysozyme M1 (1,4-beta-N-acetylmuramidase)